MDYSPPLRRRGCVAPATVWSLSPACGSVTQCCCQARRKGGGGRAARVWAVGTVGTEPPLCDGALGTGMGWAGDACWLLPCPLSGCPSLRSVPPRGWYGGSMESHSPAWSAIPVVTAECVFEPPFPNLSN